MRPVVTLIMCLLAGTASAAEPAKKARQAIVVAIGTPGSGVPPLERAHADALQLSELLMAKAGYERVSTLIGDRATSGAVSAGIESAVADMTDDGTLLLVVVAHGAGGDFGDPAILTHGATVVDPSGSGLALDSLASALTLRTPDQNIVVIMDTAHDEAVQGVALIGPAASDWPGLPGWGLAVTTKGAGEGGPEGRMLPIISLAMSGEADSDFDGSVTISELSQYLDASMAESEDMTFDRAGAVAANLVLSTSGRTAPPAAMTPAARLPSPTARKPFKLKPVAAGLASAGALAGVISLGMYVAKRGECEDQGGQLVCGDDDAYRRYRTTQVALGWTGAGLFAAGVGFQFMPVSQGAMVGIGGRF